MDWMARHPLVSWSNARRSVGRDLWQMAAGTFRSGKDWRSDFPAWRDRAQPGSDETGAINAQIRDEIQAFDSARQYLQDQNLILPFFDLQEITAVVQAKSRFSASREVLRGSRRARPS